MNLLFVRSDNMRRLISLMIILFFSFSLAYSISINNCKSDGKSNWDCENNNICICSFSGSCTNGRLLVYETDVRNVLCMPKIVNNYVDIDWDDCWNPSGKVKVRADCDEGQSSEKTIIIVSSGSGGGSDATTSSTTTTTIICNYACQASCTDDNDAPFCYKRVSHGTTGCSGGLICCESVLKDCQSQTTTTIQSDKTCPYDCCIDMLGYKYKPCSGGMSCCDGLCKESCGGSDFKISKSLMFWVLLGLALPIVALIIFAIKRGNNTDMSEY